MAKMCAELGITPMAEYIETEEEHSALKELGFELVQGFHYGHPKPLEPKDKPSPVAESSQQDDSEASQQKPPSGNRLINCEREQLDKFQKLLDSSEDLLNEQQIDIETVDTAEVQKPKDKHWLLEQPADHYAIQLMLSSKRSQAESSFRGRRQPQNYAIYKKNGRTRVWHVVVCGSFEGRDAAKKEAENFKDNTISTWGSQHVGNSQRHQPCGKSAFQQKLDRSAPLLSNHAVNTAQRKTRDHKSREFPNWLRLIAGDVDRW